MQKLILILLMLVAFYLHSVAQRIENKTVTTAELEALIPAERLEKARNWFITTDKNGDGMISLEEFPENIMHFWPLANTNNDNFQAIFTGSVSADGNSIIAQLTNNMGHYGTMLMIRREELMKY